MKICYNCKQTRVFNFFHKDSTKADGYYPICKDCRRLRKGSSELVRAEVIGLYNGVEIVYGNPYPYIKGTRIRAHRYIMEHVLGRKLVQKEHVHHINGDKFDFRVENLCVLNNSDHHRLHPTPKGDGITAKCISCGKERWLNEYELTHRYGKKQEHHKIYRCRSCGGGGRKSELERMGC